MILHLIGNGDGHVPVSQWAATAHMQSPLLSMTLGR